MYICVSFFNTSGPNQVRSAGTILDDIGNMFDDLADQLDAMLDWHKQEAQRKPQEVTYGLRRPAQWEELLPPPEHQHLVKRSRLHFSAVSGLWLQVGTAL